MAFDHDAERLNGIYDFGDSGFGDLHKEFVPPSWISPDFVERLAKDYERLTGQRDRSATGQADLRRAAIVGARRICGGSGASGSDGEVGRGMGRISGDVMRVARMERSKMRG